MSNVKQLLKQLLIAAISTAALSLSAVTLAQAPAAAPPAASGMEAGGMGGMMQYPDSKEDAARKEVVQNFGALIDAGKVDEAFEKYVSKDYVEHAYTPRRMSGQDKMGYNEIKPFFEKFMVRAPGDTSKLVEIMVVNDELVTYNGRKGQDIFRVANGKITDHWDTIHQGAGGSPAAAK